MQNKIYNDISRSGKFKLGAAGEARTFSLEYRKQMRGPLKVYKITRVVDKVNKHMIGESKAIKG